MPHKSNPLQHEIVFSVQNKLHISLKTNRLFIRSIMAEDTEACAYLTSNPKVMATFAGGNIWDEKYLKARMEIWLERWNKHDPFSAYSILDAKSNTFIGIIVIGHSAPGEGEAAYLINSEYWGKRYGSEAADAIFQSLIPRLVMRNYLLDQKPLKKLVATTRLDNIPSQKMLQGVGFQKENTIFNFGAWRYGFGIFTKKLKNDYQQFFTSLDRKQYVSQQAKIKNIDVDITDLEMAMSSFGQKR